MDPIPAWIRIRVIPIPALLDVIPAPDPDPQKSGIVTPLVWSIFHINNISIRNVAWPEHFRDIEISLKARHIHELSDSSRAAFLPVQGHHMSPS